MDTLSYLNRYIRPKIHNLAFYNSVIVMLKTPVYVADFSIMNTYKNLICSGNDLPVPIVSLQPVFGYRRILLLDYLDTIPSSFSSKYPYQHDWWEKGNLDHSMQVYEEAVYMWKKLKKVLIKHPIDKKFLEDTEDAVRLGSFLHDIGKAVIWAYKDMLKDYNTQLFHEIYGSFIFNTINCSNSYLKTSLVMCGLGHSGYVTLSSGKTVIKNKIYPLANDHYSGPIAPFIVCFADKISSAKSRVGYELQHNEGINVIDAQSSLELNLDYIYRHFCKTDQQQFKFENNGKGLILRQIGYGNEGFGLYCYEN